MSDGLAGWADVARWLTARGETVASYADLARISATHTDGTGDGKCDADGLPSPCRVARMLGATMASRDATVTP